MRESKQKKRAFKADEPKRIRTNSEPVDKAVGILVLSWSGFFQLIELGLGSLEPCADAREIVGRPSDLAGQEPRNVIAWRMTREKTAEGGHAARVQK